MRAFLLIILLAGSALSAADFPTDEVARLWSRFSTEAVRNHLAFLGSDACQGRATGSEGERLAARYLVDHLSAIEGIEGALPDGGFFQNIPLHGSQPQPGSRLILHWGKEEQHNLRLGRDYLLFKTGADTFVPAPVPLLFVGYGIVAPEYDYNDYQDIDVTGAIVVFLEGEPRSEDPSYFDGSQSTLHSLPEMKQRLAASRGARGSIMISEPKEISGKTWAYWRRTFAFEHVTLPYQLSGNFSAMIHPAVARALFHNVRYELDDIHSMAEKHTLRSFSLRMKCSFEGRFKERQFRSANVAAILPGKDPKLRDEYVLVSAHYDHLGIGPAILGDRIYNGVVDNALGSAGVLEMARFLASMKLKRSVLFLWVTGEEKGLLGSRYYCQNPVRPLHKTIACVNVDGLAIIDDFRDVIGVGADLSTLGEKLAGTVARLGMTTSELPAYFGATQVFTRSDQLSFAQAGIPAILVSDGFDYREISREAGLRAFVNWGEQRYHTPLDDLSQPIDFDAVNRHCQVITAFIASLANDPEPPQWITEGRYLEARLKSIALKN